MYLCSGIACVCAAHVCVEDASAPRVSWLVLARGVAAAPPLGPAGAPEEARAPDEAPRFLPLPQRALLYTSKYIALVSSQYPLLYLILFMLLILTIKH